MYGELQPIKLSDSDSSVPGFPVVIESSPTGPKTAVLRLPTSDEMVVYLQAQRSNYRDLGRRKSQAEDVLNPKADEKLFRSILLGQSGEEFDFDEMKRAIDLVIRHKVKDCTREGNDYRIVLATPFGDCTHVVRMPYESEKARYYREFFKTVDLPHGVEERRFPPEAPIRLYDSIICQIDGYAVTDGTARIVPPHHKRSVVNELLSTLASLDPDLDPNS